MKDTMMTLNLVAAFVAGIVALWKSIEAVSWIFGGDLTNPKSSVGVLLVGLAVFAFVLFNAKAIFEGWPDN